MTYPLRTFATNILVSIQKGAPIYLDDTDFVRARKSTCWDGDHGTERVAHEAYRRIMDERAPELMISCMSRFGGDCSAYTLRLAQRWIDGWGNDSKRV